MELYRTMQLPSMQWGALQQTLIAADVINILGVLRIPNQALSLMPVCTCVYVYDTSFSNSSIPHWITSLINTTVTKTHR